MSFQDNTTLRLIQPEIAASEGAFDDVNVLQVDSCNPTRTIMVQICDPVWTLSALAKACPLAVELNASIALINMLPVQHLSWLGTAWGFSDNTKAEYTIHANYVTLVASYGIPVFIQPFQYVTLTGALLEAAEYVRATIVFGTLPVGVLPVFQCIQIKRLRRDLHKQDREFFPMP